MRFDTVPKVERGSSRRAGDIAEGQLAEVQRCLEMNPFNLFFEGLVDWHLKFNAPGIARVAPVGIANS